jgi:hypothetical protein
MYPETLREGSTVHRATLALGSICHSLMKNDRYDHAKRIVGRMENQLGMHGWYFIFSLLLNIFDVANQNEIIRGAWSIAPVKKESRLNHFIHFQLQNIVPICLQIPSNVKVTFGTIIPCSEILHLRHAK